MRKVNQLSKQEEQDVAVLNLQLAEFGMQISTMSEAREAIMECLGEWKDETICQGYDREGNPIFGKTTKDLSNIVNCLMKVNSHAAEVMKLKGSDSDSGSKGLPTGLNLGAVIESSVVEKQTEDE